MKLTGITMILFILLTALSSCNDEPGGYYHRYKPIEVPADTSAFKDNPLWQRHHGSSLKILAIGNSFTVNATTDMPWLINHLNGDSICIARLTRGGCSLKMHWEGHIDKSEEYDLYYSDNGKWTHSDIRTLDEALEIFDWDIITLQQVSGHSGLFSTYQPYLFNLVTLLHETNLKALLGWHCTWAYTPWTEHPDFKYYDRSSEKMYYDIMNTYDRISGCFDICIPSATLVKQLREEFPEVENGFSEDGFHIVDNFAVYVLSSLWYDVLVRPVCGTSRESLSLLPWGVGQEEMEKAEAIISDVLTSQDPRSSQI